jgi:glycosyltransferase involved in cell wall biosynthesis
MKILIAAYSFTPSIGGIEEITALLARDFVARGNAIKVVTMTQSSAPDSEEFDIIRSPDALSLMRAIAWCDVFLQQNVGFRLGWPNLRFRRPWVIALHSNLDAEEGRDGVGAWKSRVKRASLALASHVIACSHAVARRSYPAATVIPNAYRDTLFRSFPDRQPAFDLVFLGRLVSDKGAGLLIEALDLLRKRGFSPSLLIIGEGPDEELLRAMSRRKKLDTQITFAGLARGEALVALLNRCRIMVVPSMWEEPFGIVALEGIACGCAVVGAEAGGLPEAIGPCGLTFRKGDPEALATVLSSLLSDESSVRALTNAAISHLARHRPRVVGEAYLGVLAHACGLPQSEGR